LARRRASCSNNLKQIGLGLHMHHDTYNRLPAGWRGRDPASGQPHWFGLPGWGWAAYTLPCIEQTAVYENLVDLDVPITDPENDQARVTAIKTFRCPSDVGERTFNLQGGGPSVGNGVSFPVELATGNYIGVFGTVDFHHLCEPGEPDFNGCEGNGTFFLNRRLPFSEFRDGLSNTLVVGERSSKLAPSTWVGVVTGGEHGVARVAGVATYPPNSEQEPDHYHHNFSSFHPAGTNFVTADGSVKAIAETIDEATYHALCTRMAGDVVGGH
jgi:hypothetical protein